MNDQHSKLRLVPSLAAAAVAAALATSASAQTPAPASQSPSPATTGSPMTGHHRHPAAKDKHGAETKAECQAMMTRHKEMQEKMQAMDATLDKLVAEMNAARESKTADSMGRPMAAVLNELVAQRKASRTMMMEMQHGSMAHMSHHMPMRGMKGEKGAMECPMMKADRAADAKTEEKKPGM